MWHSTDYYSPEVSKNSFKSVAIGTALIRNIIYNIAIR